MFGIWEKNICEFKKMAPKKINATSENIRIPPPPQNPAKFLTSKAKGSVQFLERPLNCARERF